MLATLPSARLACLNVLKLGRITIDRTLDEQGHNKHIDRLVALRHWASPLKLDESRLTVHVLEAIDPASAILEFAEVNHVDHIVIGARQNSLLRTLLGSVSAKVAAEAACTVTVVRPPRSAKSYEAANLRPPQYEVSEHHGEERGKAARLDTTRPLSCCLLGRAIDRALDLTQRLGVAVLPDIEELDDLAAGLATEHVARRTSSSTSRLNSLGITD